MNSSLPDRPSLRALISRRDLIGAEIGVGEGRNALNMLETLNIKTLYLIDPYNEFGIGNSRFDSKCHNPQAQAAIGFSRARPLMEKYNSTIVWINKVSHEAAVDIPRNSLDFIYIDGSHRYKEVREDIIDYSPKVKKGGIIGGHDYNRKTTVGKAVKEILGEVHSAVVESNPETQDWWVIK